MDKILFGNISDQNISEKIVISSIALLTSYSLAKLIVTSDLIYAFPIMVFSGYLLFVLRIPVLINLIFVLSLFFKGIGHAFIQNNIWSISSSPYESLIFWIIDGMAFVLVIKLLTINKYRDKTIVFLIILLSFIIATSVLNSQSLFSVILAFRSNYCFILLIYSISIYEFSDKFYVKYYKLFLVLAIISSLFSLISFMYYGTNSSGDTNGGIFGWHGTGIGVIFAVIQAYVFFQMFVETRKNLYALCSVICLMFIVTGKAYFGIYLFIGLFVIYIIQIIKQIKKIFVFLIATTFAIIFFSGIAIQLLSSQEITKVHNRLNSVSSVVNYDYSVGRFGRIGSVLYGVNSIKKSVPTLLFGYGIGSISYRGKYTKISNNTMDSLGLLTTRPSLIFIYELGIVGCFLMILFIVNVLIKWIKIKNVPKDFVYGYIRNIPIILFAFAISIFYTNVFQTYILIVLFSLHISFLRKYINNNIDNGVV